MAPPITRRKGIMPPPPLPLLSPSTPSSSAALVLRGPHTPSSIHSSSLVLSPRTPSSMPNSTHSFTSMPGSKGASTPPTPSSLSGSARTTKTVTIQVKTERIEPSAALVPSAPASGPRSRSKSRTPAPASSPLRRAPSSSHSAQFAAWKASSLARRRGGSKTPSPRSSGKSRSAAVEDEREQDDFWRGSGSNDEPIEVDADPSPSATISSSTRGGVNQGRADSEFSTASLDSHVSEFRRASTWADLDPRYGRDVPSIGFRSRQGDPLAQAQALANGSGSAGIQQALLPSSPISLGFLKALVTIAEMIKDLPSKDIVKGEVSVEAGVGMTEVEKVKLVINAFFSRAEDDKKRLIEGIVSSCDGISPHTISSVLEVLRTSSLNSLLAHCGEYKSLSSTTVTSKGTKDARQLAWFSSLKYGLIFSTSEFRAEVGVREVGDVLSVLRIRWSTQPELNSLKDRLSRYFNQEAITANLVRRLADCLTEFNAQIVSIAWES